MNSEGQDSVMCVNSEDVTQLATGVWFAPLSESYLRSPKDTGWRGRVWGPGAQEDEGPSPQQLRRKLVRGVGSMARISKCTGEEGAAPQMGCRGGGGPGALEPSPTRTAEFLVEVKQGRRLFPARWRLSGVPGVLSINTGIGVKTVSQEPQCLLPGHSRHAAGQAQASGPKARPGGVGIPGVLALGWTQASAGLPAVLLVP